MVCVSGAAGKLTAFITGSSVGRVALGPRRTLCICVVMELLVVMAGWSLIPMLRRGRGFMFDLGGIRRVSVLCIENYY